MAHGGDIYNNNVRYDFSVNINPLGMPEAVKNALEKGIADVIYYPEYQSDSLRKKIADYCKLSPANVICGNGASELIMAVAHAFKPKRAVVPVPSFSGYRYVLQAADTEIVYYYTSEENNFIIDEGFIDFLDSQKDVDILFLANPNNPVGNLIDKDLMDKLLHLCNKNGIIVLLDECFIELSSGYEDTRIGELEDMDNLLIIRAFTKSFAVPALRLGYLLGTDKNKLKKISEQLPEWNVSVLAQRAGEAAVNSGQYQNSARSLIENERRYLVKELASMGIKVYPSDTNFIMIKTALPLYDTLLKKEILIRDCSDFEGLCEGFYRIAVKKHEENEILIDAVKSILLG